jgi:hypothetical protein
MLEYRVLHVLLISRTLEPLRQHFTGVPPVDYRYPTISASLFGTIGSPRRGRTPRYCLPVRCCPGVRLARRDDIAWVVGKGPGARAS